LGTIDRSDLGNSLSFGWNNGTNWGSVCTYRNNTNYWRVYNSAVSYSVGASIAGVNNAVTYTRFLGGSIGIVCNGSYTWTVSKSNGEATSANATSTFTVTGCTSPTVTSLNLSSNSIIKREPITFTVGATDDGRLSSILLSLSPPSGSLIPVSLTPTSLSTTAATATGTWTSTCTSQVGTYTAIATATDSCALASSRVVDTFTVSDPIAPVVDSVTSTDTDNLVATRVPMPLSASVSGAGVTAVQIFISSLASATGPVVNSSYASGPVQYCNTSPCVSNYSWTPPCGTPNGYYSARAVGRHSCGNLSVGGPTYVFEVENSYNLSVRTNILSQLLTAGTTPNCSGTTAPTTPISVTLQTDPTLGIPNPYSRTLASGAGNPAFFSIIPEHASTVRVTSGTYSPGQCRGFDFYCIGSELQTSAASINFNGSTDCSTKTSSISLAENLRPSWMTLLDGNVYARSADLSIGCTAATVGGGFVPTFVNTSPLGKLGGVVHTAGDIIAVDTDSIYNPRIGYAKDLDPTLSTPLKSSDTWLNDYTFPDTIPTYARLGTSLANLTTTNPVIYINGSLVVPTSGYASSLSGAYIVYVNGNLTINGPITGTGSLIIFIVKGNVSIGSGVGTAVTSLTTNSAANVKAGIVALGDITFPTAATPPDRPIVIEGFLMSKGAINFNRDLGSNNSWYPSHVVRFDRTMYSKFNTLVNTRKTGVETYDVQWIYD